VVAVSFLDDAILVYELNRHQNWGTFTELGMYMQGPLAVSSL
jgi:hypothetical protein